jgi:hypothetical protein
MSQLAFRRVAYRRDDLNPLLRSVGGASFGALAGAVIGLAASWMGARLSVAAISIAVCAGVGAYLGYRSRVVHVKETESAPTHPNQRTSPGGSRQREEALPPRPERTGHAAGR